MKRYLLTLVTVSVLIAGCGKQVFTGKREARGVWMSRYEYASKDPAAAREKIRSTFEKAHAARFNMIFFQVRGNGDAFYHSTLEPWAESLSDSLGKDPGWDPLQFAIDEAHRLGMELHAWMNTFPYWRGGTIPPPSTPLQPYRAHPEWIVCDAAGRPMKVEPPANDYVWASPGNPEVRKYILSVVMDLLARYDVDGIHFDYIRYPENSPARGYSHDSVSVARFSSVGGNPEKLAWDHWQREQVNAFVIDAYNAVTASKPWVKMSASVIGKYMGNGWTSYSAVYQDPRRWMEIGKIDFIVPMVYWERTHPTHPFIPLITEWHDRVAYDRQVLPGLATRLIGKYGFQELAAQIDETRKHGLPGVVFFSATGLEKTWGTIGINEFPYWSLTPPMPWKDTTRPAPPTGLRAERTGKRVNLSWQLPPSGSGLQFVVYRSASQVVSTGDVFSIVSVTGRGATEAIDSTEGVGNIDSWYGITSVSRAGMEGRISESVQARSPNVTQSTP